MKQSIQTGFLYSSAPQPEAYVAKNKQRVKQHDFKVYLSNEDEYQIELFNPTQSYVLAKIKLDGKYISNGGIVLRPGERVFLERYLDTNNKFVYRTYEVNGNNSQVQTAIQNNGKVEVEFYNEYVPMNLNWNTGTTYVTTNGSTFTTGVSSQWDGTITTMNYNTSITPTSCVVGTQPISNRKIETGTTEKGSSSEQTFEHSNKTFNTVKSRIFTWQILPTSQKPYTSKELNVLYCGECGAKRKKDSHKFCPHCGTKY